MTIILAQHVELIFGKLLKGEILKLNSLFISQIVLLGIEPVL